MKFRKALEKAKQIAQESECGEKGELTDNISHNEDTHTWWIDLDMKPEYAKGFCNPACVVSEKTLTASINWRCLGGLSP